LNDSFRQNVECLIDPLEVAALVGTAIDWNRTNPLWTQLGVSKVNPKGETVLAGAGRSTRAAMFAVVAKAIHERWPHTVEVAKGVLPGLFQHEAVAV
jgi:hypothetical protein